MSNDKVYVIPIHVGAMSVHIEELSVQATKQTISQEIVTCLVNRLSLPQSSNYCLAEVISDANGQECKERKLNASENPVKVMLLWPKNSWKPKENYYRFCLREKVPHSDLLWSDNFAMDPQLIKDYFNRFLYQPKDREYPDLCQLPDLNEQTLLENLRARFLAGHIYTYVGSILIAVNPFKFYPIYNPKYVKLYQNRRLGTNLPPHIFAVADNAYHSMLKYHKNQCVVISGESGSGKTESTNFLLHHLTALSQKGSHGSGVEQTILSAGPVLEAFGNAKTAHNNNSSRFGKFIQVNYKDNGMVHGAVVQKYLLEKSRICSQGRHERNYHVFYYLLAGASEVETKVLHLKPINEYHYLNQSGSFSLESVDEKYEFSRLKQSMEMVGFTIEKQRRLFSVLSAVLLLGNVQFQPRKLAYHHDEAVAVQQPEIVTLISDLLLVKQETLMAALTSKRARASGETLVINYRLPEAIASRDAMAKCLYGALFDWIVLQVNHALLSKKDTYLEHQGNSIGVLDIFGFEDFGICNSFEQYCINYANEHLQFYFNQHVFKYEQEEYRKEGIRWTNIDFMDNTGCLQLIEGKPNGLLCILDDQCNFPGATSETLLQKFNSVHKNNLFYETPQKREAAFIVLHYAGKVKYQVNEMREKNLDLMRQDIVSVLKNSSMAFVRELVGADPVAVFRWAIVRALFRSYFALRAAGRKHRQNRSDKNKVTSSSYQNRYILIKNGKQRAPPRQQFSSSTILNASGGCGYQTSKFRQCDYFSSKNRILDTSSDYYHRNREPVCHSPITNSVLERMLCPNEARVLQRANQIVMKNKSFRPRERASRKSLKNLQSVKTLAGRTGIQSATQLNKARKQPLTVTAQFQNSLHLLMDTLNQANPFFIRCIKSNSNKIANQFDDDTVQRQLRYTGMLETVRIRQAGFNVRLTYDEFIQLYRILLPKGLLSSQNDVKYFLLTLNLNIDNYQLGISKIFFRESEKVKLDCKLHQQIMASIVTIQRWFRSCLERRRFLRLKNAVILIQSYWRMTNAQRTLLMLRNRLMAATHIQAVWRGHRTRKWFRKFKRSLIEFQAHILGYNARKRFRMLKKQVEIQKMCSDEAFISTASSQEELLHDHQNQALLHDSNESGIQEDLDIEPKKRKDHNLRPTFSLPSVAIRTFSSNGSNYNALSDSNKLEGAILDSISLRKSKLNKNYKSIDSAENDLFSKLSNEPYKSKETQSRKLSTDKKCNSADVTSREDYFSKIERLQKDLRYPSEKFTSNQQVLYHPNKALESTVSLPEVPTRAIRRTRRDVSRRSAGEDMPDATAAMNFVDSKNAVLLTTIRENNANINNNAVLKFDQNSNWQLKGNVINSKNPSDVLYHNQSPNELSTIKNLELRRRNSDPVTPSSLVIVHNEPLPNYSHQSYPVSSSCELEWQSHNSFTIAGHRFRKITRFSKDDRCVYCNEEMDAFVTQGHKCVECKQLFHTKCIQNRGVLQMPCSAQSNQENAFQPLDSSLSSSKTRRKYRKHTRTPYDIKKQLQQSQQQPSNLLQPQNNASNFSLTGMPREFTDRTDKIISDAHELQLMQDFITKKIYKMESEEGQKPSEVDRVFKQALREFKDNLVATYSVVNKKGFESLNIKYKDLIANFCNVMETVTRQRHNETDFPVTMGVNAFRGFMNEFMTTRNEFDKPSKSKRKKEKKRRKADDAIQFAGHSFQLTIINIPTACEICNSFFMWPLERSLVCQSCKLTCHKKCYVKVQSECAKDSNHQQHHVLNSIPINNTFKVFGVPLYLLLTHECKIPVVIDKLITTIEMYGLYTEGIYRKSGVSSKVKELKQKMEESCQDSVNFENYQVHVLAAVLKSFLRDMPEPLLTFDCYEDFLRAASLADSQERVSTLFGILRKLPKPNYDLMERLIFHLARVALHENVNRMNANSLAIVFAPCILRTNTILVAQESLSDISRQTQSIEIIIVEQLRKLKSTLADIETLDTACHTASYRLSSLRCSKIFSYDDLQNINNITTENGKDNKNEKEQQAKNAKNQEDEEEALLEGHIYEIRKEKAHLTSTLPNLTRSNSDEDILSTDLDGEGSLDDMSSFAIQHSIDLSDENLAIHKRGSVITTIPGNGGGNGMGAVRSNLSGHHRLLRRQLSADSTNIHPNTVEKCDDTPIIV